MNYIYELFRQGRDTEAFEEKRVRCGSRNLEIVERKAIFFKSEFQIELTGFCIFWLRGNVLLKPLIHKSFLSTKCRNAIFKTCFLQGEG